MKVLIDEQLPTKLKFRFADSNFTVSTVRDMDWLGKKNGELLKLMLAHDFDVLLTNDKNMHYQQNTVDLKISILNVNAKTNRYDDILEKITAIKEKLSDVAGSIANSQHNYYIID